MSTALHGVFRSFTARLRTACAVLATAALVALAAPAQATLIGNVMGQPDLFASSLSVIISGDQISADNSSYTLLDIFKGSQDIWLTGSYHLDYSPLAALNSFSVTGTIDNTPDSFYLTGHITKAGASDDGRAYDFLVQLDSIDPVLAALGFGQVGSLVYTDLLLTGDQWESDTVPAIPEPSTCLLFGAGLLLAAALRRRLQ